jgi:MFS transporter, DHA2 family, multidrug resistance protein
VISSAHNQPLVLISTVLAVLLYAIDATIVNVALPHVQGSLQATQEQAAWVATAYIVVSAIFTPLSGWLGTRFGLRRVLLLSVAGFTACSMLCGVATSMPEMVVFRAMQGACGAGLIPLSQVTLLQEFPRERHVRVIGVWAMSTMLGPVIGPTIGGYLTDALSWRWAFYINLPIGTLAWIGLAASVPRDHSPVHRPFDMTGFVLLSLFIGLAQLMIDRGQTQDWFSSPEIVAEIFFAAVALYMYVVHALTARHAFLDTHLFRDRNFVNCLFIQGSIGAVVLAPGVLLPSLLQNLLGYSPAQAGALLAARGIFSIPSMFLISRVPAKVDTRIVMLTGVAVVTGSLLEMASFSTQTPAHLFFLAGVIQGIGSPMTWIPMNTIAFATLPDRSRAEAGALLTLARNFGSAIGISLSVAYLARSAQINQSYLAEHFTPYSIERWQAFGVAPGANVSTGELMGEVLRQSLAIAYSNTFVMLCLAALACVPLILMLRRTRRSAIEASPRGSVTDAPH